MANQSSKSSPVAWWILILAVLAVATALILVWVARRSTPRGSKGADASASRMGSPTGSRTDRHSADDPDHRRSRTTRRLKAGSRVDRRRLAKLLGRNNPPNRPTDGDPGRGRGSSGSGGDNSDEEPPTVFPITAKGIRGAIQARIEEIKACYDGWLATDDTLGGKLVLAFTIESDPDGDLARISVAEIQGSTLDHPALERCVLVMAESLSFEAPADGKVTVRYPFRFSPGK